MVSERALPQQTKTVKFCSFLPVFAFEYRVLFFACRRLGRLIAVFLSCCFKQTYQFILFNSIIFIYKHCKIMRLILYQLILQPFPRALIKFLY